MAASAGKRKLGRAVSHAKRIARRFEGITGVDYGYVYKDGKRTSKQGIRFHVAAKRPLDSVKPDQTLPDTIHELECDVIESVYKPQAAAPATTAGALAPGLSIGNLPRRKTGTLGLIVADANGGARCVLSNWHVLAGSPDCAAGDAIIQPGPAALGVSDPPNQVAELLRWTNLAHGCDAAIARVQDGAQMSNMVANTGGALRGTQPAVLGMKLAKIGMASGLTHALVDGINGSYPIDYSNYGDTTRWMDGIHLVHDPSDPNEEITLDGDSGAIWFQPDTGKVVALNFAGEDDLGPLAEYALGHDISQVITLLNILVPET
jgi:hypothetical protein